MSSLRDLQPGDIVYAKVALYNEDGEIPVMEEGEMIAEAGTRGVIVNIGHLEHDPDKELFLVRFEQADEKLGPPTGCWPEELSAEALS